MPEEVLIDRKTLHSDRKIKKHCRSREQCADSKQTPIITGRRGEIKPCAFFTHHTPCCMLQLTGCFTPFSTLASPCSSSLLIRYTAPVMACPCRFASWNYVYSFSRGTQSHVGSVVLPPGGFVTLLTESLAHLHVVTLWTLTCACPPRPS